MAGAPETLPAVASRAVRCAKWVLITTLFGLGAQAQPAPGSDIRAALSGRPLDLTRPTSPTAQDQRPSGGNPLWEIALSALQETRARPIFSPSRRPPSPPVVAASPPPAPKAPEAKEPERLKLTLLGTVTGSADGIGVFVDEISNDVIRIRTGESHAGWVLRSVHRRTASFEKDRQDTTLAMPASKQPGASVDGAGSKIAASICRNDRNVIGAAQNCVSPAPSILPVSAPTTRSADKIRQDILSIGASN